MKKTEIPGIYKVSEGVLINRDNEALAVYKKMKQKNNTISEMQTDIQSLKNDMAEIKELLKGLAK